MIPGCLCGCLLVDLYSNSCQVKSVSRETLERPDVLINVVLGSGMGGVSQGAVRRYGRFHVVTALVVDGNPSAEQTHALSMPHIPTAWYNLANTEDALNLIYRYVPKSLMSKTYIHVSNSCNHASTGNMRGRDLGKTFQDTDWFLSLLEQTGCGIWTLENVPAVLRRYEGHYPTSRRIDMSQHCECAQARTRISRSQSESGTIESESE